MQTIFWFVSEVDPRNAGYRVRTLPIVNALRNEGIAVELMPIAEMSSQLQRLVAEAHAVVVAKPGDTTTYLCMRHLRRLRVPVVVDLFDNYFSWSPAFVKRQLHWQWLRALDCAALAVCSSDYLRNIVSSLVDTPVVTVGDSVPRGKGALGTSTLGSKWSPLSRRIELLWFGISGNPYYPAGLEDLAASIPALRQLASRLAPERDLRLTICTNRVPSVDVLMGGLRRNEIDARFVEWSEPACSELLDGSHVVLLPTNLTGFSLSKTHNRCSEALLHRCLVLASPSGPYFDLGGAVFTDIDTLATGLRHADAPSVDALVGESFAALRGGHDLASDVQRLVQALANCRREALHASIAKEESPPILITARSQSGPVKLSRTMGYLVGGFADSGIALSYDFRLEPVGADGIVCVTLSERARDATQRLLFARRDVEVNDSDAVVDSRGPGWRVRFDRGTRVLEMHEGLDVQTVRRLQAAQLVGRTAAWSVADWFTCHVETLTAVLRRLGYRRMDLAIDEEGGWPQFAAQASPDVAALEARLRERWMEHAGNELPWGRPATACTQ